MATQFKRFKLFDPEGNLLSEGDYSTLQDECQSVEIPENLRRIMVKTSSKQNVKSGRKILEIAQNLGILSTKGNAQGFYTILSNGKLFKRIVEKFNQPHLEALNAEQIDFPEVFDLSAPGLRVLTHFYEEQDRLFKIEQKDSNKDWRLSYAADPGLFAWLTDQEIYEEDLPYCIYSPLTGFRRWKSGELNPMLKFNAYAIPDFHILTAPEKTYDQYVQCTRINGRQIRFWMGEDWLHVLETDEESIHRFDELGPELARETKQYTLLKIASERPRYFSLKSGFMVDAGFSPIMFYNLQLDDTNGRRFEITLPKNRYTNIIHGTFAGDWPKLLPIFIGRGLEELGSKALPVELSPVQLMILPVGESHISAALELKDRMTQRGIRAAVDTNDSRVGRKIHQVKTNWIEHYTVIGDRESTNDDNVMIESWVTGNKLTLDDFWSDTSPIRQRIVRCTPQDNRIPKTLRFTND